MVLQLYSHSPVPPCRTVMTTLRALELKYEDHLIDLRAGAQKSPEFLKINPRGMVPALRDDDFCISESRAIACYLCNKYEESSKRDKLYPTDAKERGKVDEMLYVSESINDMIQSYLNLHGVLMRGESPKDDNLRNVVKACEITKAALAENNFTFIAAKHLTLADIFMAMPFYTLEMLCPTDFNPVSGFPEVQAWFKTVKVLPFFVASNQLGGQQLADTYKNAISKGK